MILRGRLVASFALLLGAALLISGCGDSSSTPTSPGNGALFTFIGDAPFCDVLSFRVLATGSTQPTLFLRIAGTPNHVAVIPSTAAIKVNFGALRDFSTVLNFTNVRAGTYDQATIVMSGPTLEVYDPTQNPPIKSIAATLPSTAPEIPIRPNLVVNPPVNGQTQVSALKIDFDLLHSVQLDSSGQVTGIVNPAMTATPITVSPDQGFGELDDVLGIVQRVATFSSNASFIGNIGLQLLQGTGTSLTVNLASNTAVDGTITCGPAAVANQPCSSALDQILTNSFAEVNGYVDAKGNFVANSVEIEDQEDPATNVNKLAFLGDILSMSKDAEGNVTQFAMYVREEEPDTGSPTVPLGSVVVVNPSPSTTYRYSSRSTNFTDLSFDQKALSIGQEVVVHGVFNRPPTPTGSTVSPPTTVAPDKIYLRLQTHQGSFSSLVQAAADNKTGAFAMTPCATLFNHAPVIVLTNGSTTFVNTSGLNGLAAQSTLLVKGLLFYVLNGGVVAGSTINSVTVPPGTLVLVAKQVRQLL